MLTPTAAGAAAVQPAVTPPEEPLALSAPLAHALAADLCQADPRHGGSCAWYHGFWQYLRLFDFVTTPRDHADFYRASLRIPARTGARRVLISGTADYAMLACVLSIFRSEQVEPAITVLDICRTPLRLCDWYAERAGARITTVAGDILDYHPADDFDILCTHSFLGRFAAHERPALIARWRALLRPDGRIVTVNRVRHGAPDKVRFTADQARRFAARVRQASERVDLRLGLPPEAIVAMADAYVAAKRTHPVRSLDELVQLFAAGGFRIEHAAVSPVGPRGTAAPSGPTMSGGAQYARIAAVRT